MHAHLVDGGGSKACIVDEASGVVDTMKIEAISGLDDLVNFCSLLVVECPELDSCQFINLYSVTPLGCPNLFSGLVHVGETSEYVHVCRKWVGEGMEEIRGESGYQ